MENRQTNADKIIEIGHKLKELENKGEFLSDTYVSVVCVIGVIMKNSLTMHWELFRDLIEGIS